MGMVPPPIILYKRHKSLAQIKEDNIYAIVEPIEKEIFKWCEVCKDFVEIEGHICIDKGLVVIEM